MTAVHSGIYVNQSLSQSAEVGTEEEGNVRRFVAPRTGSDAGDGSLETSVVRRDLLSYVMLVLLERLTPTERTLYVLREALSFDYPEIAELLGKQESNCRKLLSRAPPMCMATVMKPQLIRA